MLVTLGVASGFSANSSAKAAIYASPSAKVIALAVAADIVAPATVPIPGKSFIRFATIVFPTKVDPLTPIVDVTIGVKATW